MRKVTFYEAKKIIDKEECIILDVREDVEYNTGHAEEAVLFPVDSINEETALEIIPDKDTVILVYCRSGRRSVIAGERLEALGYRKVYDIGSLVGWPYGITTL